MKASLSGTTFEVDAAALTLAVDSLPVLRLRMGPQSNRLRPAESLKLAARNTPGELKSDQGMSLPFLALGFENAVDQATRSGSYLVGLVADANDIAWLAAKPAADPTRQLLIYQHRQAGETAWQFLGRTLGGKFVAPESADLLDPEFPLGSCIVRRASDDNFSHIQQVTRLLRFRSGLIHGWTGSLSESGAAPLRLVTLDRHAGTQLDSKWYIKTGTLPDRHVPCGNPCQLVREFGLADPVKLLREIVIAGSAIAAHAPVAEPSQALALPGTVLLEERVFLASSVTWVCQRKDDDRFDVQLILELGEPNREVGNESFPARLLDASFVDWDSRQTGGARTTATLSSDGQCWIMMDNQAEPQADNKVRMMAPIVTPFAGRSGKAGLYIRWAGRERVRVLVTGGHEPIVLGQIQSRSEEWEHAAQSGFFDMGLDAGQIVLRGDAVTLLSNDPGALGTKKAHGIIVSQQEQSVTIQMGEESRVKLEGANQKLTVENHAKITKTLDVG